jgi:hypothetical protein
MRGRHVAIDASDVVEVMVSQCGIDSPSITGTRVVIE